MTKNGTSNCCQSSMCHSRVLWWKYPTSTAVCIQYFQSDVHILYSQRLVVCAARKTLWNWDKRGLLWASNNDTTFSNGTKFNSLWLLKEENCCSYSYFDNIPMDWEGWWKKDKGTHGFEPWTYRTAADCSTTELYPLTTISHVSKHRW